MLILQINVICKWVSPDGRVVCRPSPTADMPLEMGVALYKHDANSYAVTLEAVKQSA